MVAQGCARHSQLFMQPCVVDGDIGEVGPELRDLIHPLLDIGVELSDADATSTTLFDASIDGEVDTIASLLESIQLNATTNKSRDRRGCPVYPCCCNPFLCEPRDVSTFRGLVMPRLHMHMRSLGAHVACWTTPTSG